MQLINKCPCCGEKITFFQMYKMWNSASKRNEEFLYCPFCKKKIGTMSVYERYGLFGALPLFGMPLVYDESATVYLMAGIILLYVSLLFYLLYRLIPLNCIGDLEPLKEERQDTDEKHDLLAVIIIALIFFVSIFAVFQPLFQK